MRRLIALIIMLIVPLQFAWSAAVGIDGHIGEEVMALAFHTHDHDHHESSHSGYDAADERSTQAHNDDGHHAHYHPVFTSILTVSGLSLDIALSDGPILYPPGAFFTRVPPLLDRPPLARA